MRLKRGLTGILAILMTASILCGCGDDNESSTAISNTESTNSISSTSSTTSNMSSASNINSNTSSITPNEDIDILDDERRCTECTKYKQKIDLSVVGTLGSARLNKRVYDVATTTEINYEAADSDPEDISKFINATKVNVFIEEDEISESLAVITEIAKLPKVATLELHVENLSSVLPEVAKLNNVTNLTLDSDKYSFDVTALSQMTQLTILSLQGKCVSDLSPISNLSNLEILELQDINTEPDISSLVNLPKLTELYISDTPLSDITPIANIDSLKYLSLSDTGTENLDLAIFQTLEGIGISGDMVTNNVTTAKLPNIKQFGISSAPNLTDLSCLEYFPNLERLSLYKCESIRDISPITKLKSLDHLDLTKLSNEFVIDANIISKCTKLYSLRLGELVIPNLDAIASLKNLEHLSLSEIVVNSEATEDSERLLKDISVVSNFTKLHLLSISSCAVETLDPLANLTKLEGKLYLYCNNISDITALSGKDKIYEISLWDNNISDITPLAAMPELRDLDLHKNQISDISPLANLSKLYELDLSENNVSDMSPLNKLTKMYSIDLDYNPLTELGDLSEMVCLTDLNISITKVTTISSLINSKIKHLTNLLLYHCPISEEEALAIRDVYPDARILGPENKSYSN